MTPLPVLVLIGMTGPAAAAGSCEQLAAEIADKLRANGVTQFQLEIVPTELVVGDKVVGTCDRGRKKITYGRAGTAPRPPVPASAAPRRP